MVYIYVLKVDSTMQLIQTCLFFQCDYKKGVQ